MTKFFLKILNMSISTSWLILAVLLLRLLLKKAPKWVNVLLWSIVAMRLLCPISIESGLSLIPSPETVSPEIMTDWNPQINTGIPMVNDAVNPGIADTFAPDTENSANPLQILIPGAAIVWLVGIAVLLIYTAVTYWRLRRSVNTAVILKDNIFQSEYVSSPFVLGILKPRVYLPYGMDTEEMRHVIAHERAHIRRRDHWWKPLGFGLLTLHWFNPLMWVAYLMLCRDIELACDEKVIKALSSEERADYTQALVACSVNRRMIAACPLAFGEVGVKERVKSVMNYKKPTFWIVLAAVALCIAVAVCFLTDPESLRQNVGVTYYYGTVTEQAMDFAHEDDSEKRGYITLRCDDGQTLTFWTDRPSTELVHLLDQHVMVRSRIEEETGLMVASKVSVTDNTWVNSAEEAIENAILDFNWSPRYEGMLQCADFVVLSNEGGSAATNQTDTKIYYGIALHQVFTVKNGKLEEESGSYIPTVLTFAIDREGRYVLIEYWEPRDGAYYTEDIKDKFPLFVWPDTQKYIGEQEARNIAKAEAYFGLDGTGEAQPEETEQSNHIQQEASDLAWFMELAIPDRQFQNMDSRRMTEILSEYGNLLDDYDLIARESTDGTLCYIVGYWDGAVEDSPLYHLRSQSSGVGNQEVQILYDERDLEAADKYEEPEYKYVIHNSHINHSSQTGWFLIHPQNSGWEFNDVFNWYLQPNGREYMQDAISRGIAVATPAGAYLEVSLISPQWGEIHEMIPLSEEQVIQIIAEDKQKLETGYGFVARLEPGSNSALNLEWDSLYYTEFTGVPQTVLDLATEKCGYTFATPKDIQSNIVEARLDCSWLEEPVFADVTDLPLLQTILTNAEFGYVGRCGYGAKLTISMEDGSKMVMFKGTDSCDTMVFGSYGGYMIGKDANDQFWAIFGIDVPMT